MFDNAQMTLPAYIDGFCNSGAQTALHHTLYGVAGEENVLFLQSLVCKAGDIVEENLQILDGVAWKTGVIAEGLFHPFGVWIQ